MLKGSVHIDAHTLRKREEGERGCVEGERGV